MYFLGIKEFYSLLGDWALLAVIVFMFTGAVLAATGSFTGVFVIGGILLVVGALSYGLFVKDRSQAA